MSEFILAYHVGKEPKTPEAGAKDREKWQAWLGGLGDALVNPGTPLNQSKTVSAGDVQDGGVLKGYSIVKADNLDAALEIAKSCPYLDYGSIEVAQIMKM